MVAIIANNHKIFSLERTFDFNLKKSRQTERERGGQRARGEQNIYNFVVLFLKNQQNKTKLKYYSFQHNDEIKTIKFPATTIV